MRFDYLNLRAFGHFTDYELLFDQTKNFHLIYGPNEAGKSTALRSITHFLYGFPQQTNDSFLHSNSKLRIEGQLQKSNAEKLQFIRRKGNKNTVLDVNGNALNEEIVNRFLNGISQQHFLNMFALDHVRLRDGGESLLQSGGSLGESLFSAASGISALRKVFEDLEKKSGELYKKRGSTPELNKLIKEEKELKRKISDYHLKVQAWKELERKYNDRKKEIEHIIQQVKMLRSKQEKLQRIKLTLPKIARYRNLVEKLADLGDVPPLPDTIKELREEAQQRLEAAKKEKVRAGHNYVELEIELNQIKIPEGLIEQGSLIDALYRELQSYQTNQKAIPRLEGERNQLKDQVISIMKELDSVHADFKQIDRYRLSAEKKETIRELCKQKPLLDQQFKKNEDERQEIEEELQQKESELKTVTELPDIAELERIIDMVKRAGQIDETLENLKRESEQKEAQINEEIRQLPQWDGTYEELIHLPVPGLEETIKKYQQERTELLKKQQQIQDQIWSQKEMIDRHEERLRELESLAEIPSEEKLFMLRHHRDKGWELIRKRLQQGSWDERASVYFDGQAIEDAYEDSVHEADTVADKMRIEASKVGEKNKILADIKNCQKKMVELENEGKVINGQLEKWETNWNELWSPSAIIPLTPEEMREWLNKHAQIKGMVQEYEKLQNSLSELESKRVQYIDSLILNLSQLVQIAEEKSINELLNIAEKHQKKIQADLYKRDNLKTSITDIKRKANQLSVKRKEIESKLNLWKEAWLNAIDGTTISEVTSPTIAERLLEKYDQCIAVYDRLKSILKEQETTQEQILLYQERVANVLNSVEIKIEERSVDIVVNWLNAALQQAKQDEVTIKSLTDQLKKLQANIKKAADEIEEAETTLNGLMKQAKCDNVTELEQVEKRFVLKKEYKTKIQALEEELLELGNGSSLEELIKEADCIEHDSIEVELEELKHKLDEIEPIRSQLEQEYGVVKKEYEEKIQGNNTESVLAEQKKQSLITQLGNGTDQYIQLKLASTLLQKGIEYYRNQNQDPILKRASALFSRLTLHSFVRLIVDYDEKDQPILMGVRDNGDTVGIDGMSDGTTDQLYLALRIASIEKYTKENESIPFIVDDILVHFDDIRSKETLKILLELSKNSQIIFFTHHARLVDIMSEIVADDEYQLMELTSAEAVVV